jgi:protein-disulfide isomerase
MKKEVRTLILIGSVIAAIAIIGTLIYRQSEPTSIPPVTEQPDMTEKLVRPDSPTLGPADAKVTVVEFFDPECEACAQFGPTVKSMVKEFPQVRFVFRYMPLHRSARLAASYLEAAGEQGKYWEMLELMFRKQSEWGEIHGAAPDPNRPQPSGVFERFGEELGLDVGQLKSSAMNPKHTAKADRDLADGRMLGVRQTPTIFVNGRKLLRLTEGELRTMIQSELGR